MKRRENDWSGRGEAWVRRNVARARRVLYGAGASREQTQDFERAVLIEVMAHADIGGNACEYVLARIRALASPESPQDRETVGDS